MLRFLRAHPIILLMLLTPGIPEYLSGSSPLNATVLNPGIFLFQIVANVGLYTPGALLINEARVRWNLGWSAVLTLGAAYGILEEGVALSTLFNPNAGPVGSLGVYGHWLGVNWVWLAGIVPFHALYSISVPIILLGMAVPDVAGRSLLSKRGIAIALLALAVDVLFLMVVVSRFTGYWMGTGILLASLVAIGALVVAAKRLSLRRLDPRPGPPTASKKVMAAVGIIFLLSIFLTQGIGQGLGLPPIVDFLLLFFVEGALFTFINGRIGTVDNSLVVLSLCVGLVIPIAVTGVLAEVSFPLTALADMAIVLFFRSLWSSHKGEGAQIAHTGPTDQPPM